MGNLTEQSGTSEQRVFTPAFWRALAAVSLVLASASFMNTSVFPQFDAVFASARDLSVLANAAVLLLVGVAATFRPAFLRVRVLNAGMLAALLLGLVALPISLATGSAALLVVAACLLAMGRAWCTLLAGLAASRLPHAQVQAGILIPLAFALRCFASALARMLPSWAGLAAFLAIPFAVWALSWFDARSILEETEQGEAPRDFSVTRPSSFLPLASQLFVCLFLFRLAFGFSLRFGEVGGVPLSSFAVDLLVALAALGVVVVRRRFPMDGMVQASVLLVVAGFLVMTMSLPFFDTAAVALLSAGNELFDMVAWLVLIVVASRNSCGAVAAFAWGRGVASLGSTAGAVAGVHANNLVGIATPLFDVLAGALVLLFVWYALVGLRNFSFEAVVSGVTPVEAAASSQPLSTFEERCRQVAARYGLTPRELEVFQMLARGRDRTYIQEQLVVSRNTVKAHVKHIYAKLDIHSHQDLIDLVDAE